MEFHQPNMPKNIEIKVIQIFKIKNYEKNF
jgi:hypothetical protein